MPQDLISYLSLNTWTDPRTSGQASPSLQPTTPQERTQFADQLKRLSEPTKTSANRSAERTASPRRDPAAKTAADSPQQPRSANKTAEQRPAPQNESPQRPERAPASTVEKPNTPPPRPNERPAVEPQANSAEPVETGQTQETTETPTGLESTAFSVQQQAVPQDLPAQTTEGISEESTEETASHVAGSQQTSPIAPSALSRHWSTSQSTANSETSAETPSAEAQESAGNAAVAPGAFSRSLHQGFAPQAQPRQGSEPTAATDSTAEQETGEVPVNAEQAADIPTPVNGWTSGSPDDQAASEGEGTTEDVSSFETEGEGASGQNSPFVLQAGGTNPTAQTDVRSDQVAGGERSETPTTTPGADTQRATIPLASVSPEAQRQPTAETSRQESQPLREPFAAPLETATRATGEKTAKPTNLPTLDANKPGFADKLSSYMQSAAENGKSLRIRLNPKELGVLQIEVQRVDGQTTARLEVETPAARSIVMEQLHMLRDSLQSQGIRLDQLDVELNEQLSEQSENDQQLGQSGGEENAHDESSQQRHEGDNGRATASRPHVSGKANPAVRWNTEEIDVAV